MFPLFRWLQTGSVTKDYFILPPSVSQLQYDYEFAI